MKIGIDIRTACGDKTGKGWYTYHVVKEILKQDRANEYLLYTDSVTKDLTAFHGAHIKVIHSKYSFGWHFAVIKDLKKQGVNVFFAPTSFVIPAFLPRKIKSVITVHDLVAFLHPRLHHSKAAILEWLFIKRALAKASHVLTPSKNTKKDLARIFHYSEGKITVVPLAAAVGGGKAACHGFDKLTMTREVPKDFILAVGGLEPRKNIDRLVDAFLDVILPFDPAQGKLAQDDTAHYDTHLVIVGGKGWKSGELQKKIAQAGDKIMHIENCPPEDLQALYGRAKMLVYPSFYEGFGLPPLEAMTNGCPVICSKTSSLPGVCGDAALYIDPTNTQEIANAIERVLTDKNLRDGLIKKGHEQAKKFSWQETAKKTLAAIAEISKA